jgi:putative transcriptional regulator
MNTGDSIIQGLIEALVFAQGDDACANIHNFEVPTIDVAKIRARTGLSRGVFARRIGVAKGTLLNWEQGRRRPIGPARVLLTIIDKQPSLMAELLPLDPW